MAKYFPGLEHTSTVEGVWCEAMTLIFRLGISVGCTDPIKDTAEDAIIVKTTVSDLE